MGGWGGDYGGRGNPDFWVATNQGVFPAWVPPKSAPWGTPGACPVGGRGSDKVPAGSVFPGGPQGRAKALEMISETFSRDERFFQQKLWGMEKEAWTRVKIAWWRDDPERAEVADGAEVVEGEEGAQGAEGAEGVSVPGPSTGCVPDDTNFSKVLEKN